MGVVLRWCMCRGSVVGEYTYVCDCVCTCLHVDSKHAHWGHMYAYTWFQTAADARATAAERAFTECQFCNSTGMYTSCRSCVHVQSYQWWALPHHTLLCKHVPNRLQIVSARVFSAVHMSSILLITRVYSDFMYIYLHVRTLLQAVADARAVTAERAKVHVMTSHWNCVR
jgi:hypothetical protein